MKKTIIFCAPTLLATICIIISFTQASCSKTTATKQFSGTYIGTDSSFVMGGAATIYTDTITIMPGSNNSTLLITSKATGFVLNGTASGNSLSIPAQIATSTLGTANWSGSGALTGNNINLTIADSTTHFSFMGGR